MKISTKSKQTGTSLIEVMIALLILSIGLLGLAMLQGKSLKLNTDAMLRSQATMLAGQIIESMRVNTLGSSAGHYVATAKPTTCSGCNDTNGEKRANSDLIQWYEAQELVLPAPTSSIAYSGGVYTITMRWNERGQTVTQSWEVKI